MTLQRSTHTDHAVAAPRPILRGVSHLVAACLSVPMAIVWTASDVSARQRWGLAAFAWGIAAMFTASAVLHLRPWPSHVHERLLRLDHTAIYLAITGTGVAVGVLGLRGWPSSVLVTAVVTGGVLGIALEWMPFAPPRGFSNTVYLTLGWMPILLLPWLWLAQGTLVVVLLVVGGALYTSGAAIVGLRRPALAPRWFGYHELFHLLVIVAVLLHGVMVLRMLR